MSPSPPPAEKRPVWWRRGAAWLLSLNGSPQQISLGLAMGVLVGFSPLWGLHMVIAAALATLFGVNRPAAVAAVWLSNPLTVIPIYTLTYRVGHTFVPGRSSSSITEMLTRVFTQEAVPWWDLIGRIQVILRVGEELLWPLAIGGFIVGLFAATLSYVGCRILLRLLGKLPIPRPHRGQP